MYTQSAHPDSYRTLNDGLMEARKYTLCGRDRKNRTQMTIFKKLYIILYVQVCLRAVFIQVLKGLTKVLTSTLMLILSEHTNSQKYAYVLG